MDNQKTDKDNVSRSSVAKKRITFVIPIYNEQDNLHVLMRELDQLIRSIHYSCDIIFVNDGSRDESFNILKEFERNRRDVKIVNLSRNFGHQMAVTAGLDFSRGDATIVMDADLQDPPSVCLRLIEAWERGYDVAYAQRRTRKDSIFKRTTAAAFYRTLSALADIQIPRNTGDFRLMSRRVVDELRRYREHDRFLRGMVAHVGFKQVAVPFDRDPGMLGIQDIPSVRCLNLELTGSLAFRKPH